MSEKKNKKEKKIINISRRIALIISICSAVVTLLAYSAVKISPLTFKIPAYFGLGFKYILIVDILILIFLVIAKQKAAFITAGVLLCGYNLIGREFKINLSSLSDDDKIEIENEFKIMSFNVRLLDRYNWIKSKRDTRLKIFDFLKYEDPDILCLQEFYSKNSDSLSNEAIIQKLTNSPFVYRDYTYGDSTHNIDKGFIIFSKYPLYNREYIFDNQNKLTGIYADAQINDRMVRIFNIHLKSIQLGYDDYNFIDSINKNEDRFPKIKKILYKIDLAYAQRLNQAGIISRKISESTIPVIVCGDFNDTPISYTYKIINENLVDAFVESGSGFGRTFSIKFFSFRIDYILHSKDLNGRCYKIYNENLSDHYAISCKLTFK